MIGAVLGVIEMKHKIAFAAVPIAVTLILMSMSLGSDIKPVNTAGSSEHYGVNSGYVQEFETARVDTPVVTYYNLGFNATNVPANTNIVLGFSIDMDEATINDSTFVAHGEYSGRHLATITYDDIARTATLDPLRDFSTGELVTVVASDSIRSSDGEKLDHRYTWQFTVSATQGSGIFVEGNSYTKISDCYGETFADMNDDGYVDLITRAFGGNIMIRENDGAGNFDSLPVFSCGEAGFGIVAADYNGDFLTDLATRSTYSQALLALINQGDGTYDVYSSYPSLENGNLTTADISSDGRWDLIAPVELSGYDSGAVAIYHGSGHGHFYYSQLCDNLVNYNMYVYPRAICDVDNDNDLDIAVYSENPDYRVWILLNGGRGYFNERDSIYCPDGAGNITPVDINQDSWIDFCVTDGSVHPNEAISIYLNNQDGTFSYDTTYVVRGFCDGADCTVLRLKLGDLNGDGYVDIKAHRERWGEDRSDTTFLLFNNGDGTFAEPHGIIPGPPTYDYDGDLRDVDNDGDLDQITWDYEGSYPYAEHRILFNLDNLPPGDADGSGFVDIDDIVYLIAYIFSGGPAPIPDECYGDADASGGVDIDDVVYLIAYVFSGGPAPVEIC